MTSARLRRARRSSASHAAPVRGAAVSPLSFPSADPLARVLSPGQTFSPYASYTPDLYEVEDRRTFWPTTYPTDWEPARRLSGAPARLTVYPRLNPTKKIALRPFKSVGLPFRIGFDRPTSVLVCVRRKQRREVLHARGRTGQAVRPGRRNVYSSITCR